MKAKTLFRVLLMILCIICNHEDTTANSLSLDLQIVPDSSYHDGNEHGRDEAIPSLFRECKHRIREMHPSWNITLWNEESGLQYLKNELSEYVQAKLIVCNKVSAEMEQRIDSAYAIHYFSGTWFSDNTN